MFSRFHLCREVTALWLILGPSAQISSGVASQQRLRKCLTRMAFQTGSSGFGGRIIILSLIIVSSCWEKLWRKSSTMYIHFSNFIFSIFRFKKKKTGSISHRMYFRHLVLYFAQCTL